jgi:Fe2+ transport system protein B
MLDTFIKNRGETTTFIHNNKRNDISRINWDAEYDGDIANVSLDLNTNGRNEHFDIQLDNDDLADILNIPTVNTPIHKRLKCDFKHKRMTSKHMLSKHMLSKHMTSNHMPPKHMPYMIEIDDINRFPSPELIENNKSFYTHISSPVQNEELLIPLSIKKSSRGTKRYKKHRRHNTYKVYRHIMSSKPKSSRRYSRRTL